MRVALFQPDIPQNTGTILRMAACLGVPVELIQPAGFDVSDRNLRRSGLDYLDHVSLTRHADWAAFEAWRAGLVPRPRLILLSTKATAPFTKAAFQPDDILLLGRESVGAPDYVHAAADLALRIPLQPGLRSLNIAVAAALVLGEALRQTDGYPSS